MSCTKKGYSKKGAQTVLNHMQKLKSIPKQPQRIYECPECGKWHITSKKQTPIQ